MASCPLIVSTNFIRKTNRKF